MIATAAPLRVLFIEDEAALQLSYRRYFGRRFEVASAASGADAMRQIAAYRPEVAVLDMRLDGPSMGTTNIFSVVQERSGEGRELRRIAYIDAAREPERAVFAETVARNRGVNVRFFRSVEDAKKWLET